MAVEKLEKPRGGKVPKAPKTKAIVPAPQPDAPATDEERKLDLQNKIADAQRKLAEKAKGLKTQGEVVAELYDGLPASEKVKRLEAELEDAKKELNTQALESREMEGAKDTLAELKVERNHYQAMLSLYLVQWAYRYSRRDVTVGDQRLEITISAKLGKVVDELQAELPLWDNVE